MIQSFVELGLRTVKEPRIVAKELIHLRVDRSHLWTALALAVVLNTLVYQITFLATPQNDIAPLIMIGPIGFAVVIGVVLMLSVVSLVYAGRTLGGKAQFDTVLKLLIWLQYLRFVVQIAALVLTPIIPGLAGLLVFGASLYGIWLLLNFVDVAHEFNSLFISMGVLLMSFFGIIIGLAVFISVVGTGVIGLTANV